MLILKNQPTKEELILKQALLLESPEEAEAHRIRNIMSPKNKEAEILEKSTRIKIKEDMNRDLLNKYKDTKLFTQKQVIDECIKFDMMFIHSGSFKGQLSTNLVKKLTDFVTVNNLLVSEDQYRTHVFLLGKADWESKNESGGAKLKKNQKDPLMFFRIVEKGEIYYILIDGNKSYKNLWNVFMGYFHYSTHQSRFVLAVATYTVVLLLMNLVFNVSNFDFNWGKVFLFIPCYGIGFVMNLYWYEAYTTESERKDVVLKSNMRYFEVKYDRKPYIMTYPNMFFVLLSVLYLWFLNQVSLNWALKSEGSFTTKLAVTKRLSEKEIKILPLGFIPDNLYYSNKNYIIEYTPSILFFDKKKKLVNETFTMTTPRQ